MQPGSEPRAVVDATLARIHHDYFNLLDLTTRFSLLSLFNSHEFQYDAFCSDFSPHPDVRELKKSTLAFGQRYGVLLPHAEHYITCAMYLFPAAPLEKILLLSMNYAVDFYLNDTMGREAQPTTEEKRLLYEIRDRLSALGDNLEPRGPVSMAEKASIEVLSQIRKDAPAAWYTAYLSSYLHHIDVAHRPYDAQSLGYIERTEDYIDRRCHISGMPHTVSLIEYSLDAYLDWEALDRAGVGAELRRLNWTVSLVGALTNDLFSFEKEVIDNRTDANLIVILIMNNFRMGLAEAIELAGSIIRHLLTDYKSGSAAVREKVTGSSVLTVEQRAGIDRYLVGLKTVLQACWTWQTATRRYKRERSIWMETSVMEPVVM